MDYGMKYLLVALARFRSIKNYDKRVNGYLVLTENLNVSKYEGW